MTNKQDKYGLPWEISEPPMRSSDSTYIYRCDDYIAARADTLPEAQFIVHCINNMDKALLTIQMLINLCNSAKADIDWKVQPEITINNLNRGINKAHTFLSSMQQIKNGDDK